jgi:hypothetical protein
LRRRVRRNEGQSHENEGQALHGIRMYP